MMLSNLVTDIVSARIVVGEEKSEILVRLLVFHGSTDTVLANKTILEFFDLTLQRSFSISRCS